jgi:hypothetical protein
MAGDDLKGWWLLFHDGQLARGTDKRSKMGQNVLGEMAVA